jgi:hypothetical protein
MLIGIDLLYCRGDRYRRNAGERCETNTHGGLLMYVCGAAHALRAGRPMRISFEARQ